jgi:site-specific DNA recombinase
MAHNTIPKTPNSSSTQINPASKGPAVVYCRISGLDDERTGSLESQAEGAIKLARQMGYSVAPEDVIHERFTGAELYDRPKLAEVRAAVKAGRFKALVCHSTDRLSRKPVHLMILAEECQRYECELLFVTEPLDNTPEAQLIQYIKGYAAEMEREKIKERTLRGKQMVLASGRLLCSGPAKYGYAYDRQTRSRVIDPEAADVVRQIFRWAAEEGRSATSIARRLNRLGIRSPFAQKGLRFKDERVCAWGKTAVHRILRDETYLGMTLVNQHRSSGKYKNGRQRLEAIPRSEWRTMSEGLTPPIITPELFAAVQARLDSNSKRADATRNATRAYLLRGLIYCAKCGKRMYSNVENSGRLRADGSRSVGVRTYRCSSRSSKSTGGKACGCKRVPAGWIEDIVWEKVLEILSDPAALEAEVKRALSDSPDDHLRNALDIAEKGLAKELRIEKRLFDEWKEEEDEEYAAKLHAEHTECRGRVKAWRREIEELEGRLSAFEGVSASVEAFRSHCARVANELSGEVPFEARRAALEALGAKVRADGRSVTIEINTGVLATTSS